MHAVFLAQELEIGEVIVPRFPGAFSAWGMLETEIRKDSGRAYFTPLAMLDHDDLAATLRALERRRTPRSRRRGSAATPAASSTRSTSATWVRSTR